MQELYTAGVSTKGLQQSLQGLVFKAEVECHEVLSRMGSALMHVAEGMRWSQVDHGR